MKKLTELCSCPEPKEERAWCDKCKKPIHGFAIPKPKQLVSKLPFLDNDDIYLVNKINQIIEVLGLDK